MKKLMILAMAILMVMAQQECPPTDGRVDSLLNPTDDMGLTCPAGIFCEFANCIPETYDFQTNDGVILGSLTVERDGRGCVYDLSGTSDVNGGVEFDGTLREEDEEGSCCLGLRFEGEADDACEVLSGVAENPDDDIPGCNFSSDLVLIQVGAY